MNYITNFIITILATTVWFYMFQESVAAKIRRSKYWFFAWLLFIWLSGVMVIGWFNMSRQN